MKADGEVVIIATPRRAGQTFDRIFAVEPVAIILRAGLRGDEQYRNA